MRSIFIEEYIRHNNTTLGCKEVANNANFPEGKNIYTFCSKLILSIREQISTKKMKNAL